MLNSKNIQYVERLYKQLNKQPAVSNYKKYSRISQTDELIHSVIKCECSPIMSKQFNIREGLMPELENKAKVYMKNVLKLDAQGNPEIENNANTYGKDRWITYNGFRVAPFDLQKSTHIPVSEEFGHNAFKDDRGRIYNPDTHTLWDHPRKGMQDYQILTADLPSKHTNQSNVCPIENHYSRISKIYTTTQYKERSNLYNDCFFNGLYDSFKSPVRVSSNNEVVADSELREYANSGGYPSRLCRVVIDCDNVYRNNRVLEVFKTCQFGPQLITVKNKYSNNKGSMSAVLYFNRPLTRTLHAQVLRIVRNMLIIEADTLTIDPRCKRAVQFQNPFQRGDGKKSNRLCHDTYIKQAYNGDIPVYSIEEFLNWGTKYELHADDETVIEHLSCYKNYLVNSHGFSEFKGQFNSSEQEKQWQDPFMWSDCVPVGARNNTLRSETLHVVNEYMAMNGPYELLQDRNSFSAKISNIMYDRTQISYDNSDGQITYSWVQKRVDSLLKWVVTENHNQLGEKLVEGIHHSVNICKSLKWRFFAQPGKVFDPAVFTYAEQLQKNSSTSHRYTIQARYGNNTKAEYSLINTLAKCIRLGILDSIYKDIRSTISGKVDTSNTEINSVRVKYRHHFNEHDNRSGFMKVVNVLTDVVNAQHALSLLQSQGVDISLYALQPSECVNTEMLQEAKLSNTTAAIVTNKTRKEEGILDAIAIKAFMDTHDVQEQQAFMCKVVIETLNRIVQEITACLQQDSMYKTDIVTGERVLNIAELNNSRLMNKICKQMYFEYGIPTTLIHDLVDRSIVTIKCNSDVKSIRSEKDNAEQLILHPIEDFVQQLNQKITSGVGKLWIKAVIAECVPNAQCADSLCKLANIEDSNQLLTSNDMYTLATNTAYSHLIYYRSMYSGESFTSKCLSYISHSLKSVKNLLYSQIAIEKISDESKTLLQIFRQILTRIEETMREVLNVVIDSIANLISPADRVHLQHYAKSIATN